MLCYLGSGVRHYDRKPVRIYGRPYWEFQAVIDGRIGMRLPGQAPEFAARRLWLSAPGHEHGWAGESGQPANVAVFQFLTIPELIKSRFKQRLCRDMPLSRQQCQRLETLSLDLADSWSSPRPDMPLRHEHLLLELSLIVCAHDADAPSPREVQRRDRVNAALNWFHLHMQFNPSLEEIASAAGSSPANLRRLFHEVMEDSPKKVFDQLRFQRAIQLMTDQEMKLDTVSEACGFQSASAFSRAFKQKFGCCPDLWRGNRTGHQ